MLIAVYRYLTTLLGLLVVLPALASTAPPGLVTWGDEAYRLSGGESTSFRVEFDEIPVRRWVLLVESDGAVSHLNVRRSTDGSLLFDARDERYHQVEVPWGQGESLSAVLTADGRGGVYRVSIWGPPPENYLQSYSYEVNRALEAMLRDDLKEAGNHLLAALRADPDDDVASLLLTGIDQGLVPSALGPGVENELADDDPATRRRVTEVRRLAAGLRDGERYYEALEALQGVLRQARSADIRAEILADLADVFLDLDNEAQARNAVAIATRLGLSEERLQMLADRLEGRAER